MNADEHQACCGVSWTDGLPGDWAWAGPSHAENMNTSRGPAEFHVLLVYSSYNCMIMIMLL